MNPKTKCYRAIPHKTENPDIGKWELIDMNYLYNGVKLPALPEWDKETYPYAVIRTAGTDYGGNTRYDLRAFSTPFVFRLNTNYNYYSAYFQRKPLDQEHLIG